MPIRQDPIVATLTPQLRTAFQRSISPSRWNTYLISAGHDEDRALKLYLWNASVGQSFHFPLQTVEIALRNVVSSALCNVFGPDWPQDAGCRAHIGRKSQEEIDKAKRRFFKKYRNNQPTTDQIVASLMLGFWANLTNPKYSLLWPNEFGGAFPNVPNQFSASDVSAQAEGIQIFRNRIFHHEPLLRRNLSGDYGDIARLLKWICPETERWMKANSCVPSVIRARP